jgi:hypothetical protein
VGRLLEEILEGGDSSHVDPTTIMLRRCGEGWHIGMPLYCEMVLVKKLELEARELNLKNNNQKVHTPALVYQ